MPSAVPVIIPLMRLAFWQRFMANPFALFQGDDKCPLGEVSSWLKSWRFIPFIMSSYLCCSIFKRLTVSGFTCVATISIEPNMNTTKNYFYECNTCQSPHMLSFSLTHTHTHTYTHTLSPHTNTHTHTACHPSDWHEVKPGQGEFNLIWHDPLSRWWSCSVLNLYVSFSSFKSTVTSVFPSSL